MTNYKESSNKSIFKARDLLKERFGSTLFDFIDQYPLFACPQTMLRYHYIFSLLNSISCVPGDICEFGTWKGATAVFVAKMLDELEPQSNRKVIVFDNFSGLPSPSDEDGVNAVSQIGNYHGDIDSLEYVINSFDLSHRIELIKGDANLTVKEYFERNSHLLISLAYFDFDLYDPTINAWNAIKQNMSNSGILSFDEGLDKELWVGEYKAAKEIIDELRSSGRNFSLESNNISRQPQLTLRFQ
jgi:hypothetical protein